MMEKDFQDASLAFLVSPEDWGKPHSVFQILDVEGREAGKRRKRVGKKNVAATRSAGGC